MENEEYILSQFDKEQNTYSVLIKKMIDLLNDLLQKRDIKIHSIIGRIKDRQSLIDKIRLKNKYDSISDIMDVVGLRIITYYEDEIDDVARVIEENFNVDELNSIDKRPKDADKFGYSSLHYVVSINSSRGDLPENSLIKGKKFEIQIRTVLQHAWAEVEHKFSYHSKESVPHKLKRNFSRIAALLEIADNEFMSLKNSLQSYEEKQDYYMKNNLELVEIDKLAIKKYVWIYPVITAIEEEITGALGYQLAKPYNADMYENYIDELKYFDVDNLKKLNLLLSEKKSLITKFGYALCKSQQAITNNHINMSSRHSYTMNRYTMTVSHATEGGYVHVLMNSGACLLYLSYLLAITDDNPDKLMEFLFKFFKDSNPVEMGFVLKSTYDEINT